jgi:hypothetical protein
MASASVCQIPIDGTAGTYDDEARPVRWGLLQRSKRGVFVGLEGARHADAWDWDYRNRCRGGGSPSPIPRIKEA